MIYKIFRTTAAVIVGALAFSCSSASLKSNALVAQTDQEYHDLKAAVIDYHEHAFASTDKPWVFSATKGGDEYFKDFADSYCGPDRKGVKSVSSVSMEICERRFGRIVGSILGQVYFAADPMAVEEKCSTDPLICSDLQTFEALFRNLHNKGIEDSKNEKLAKIDDWHQGKMTDAELESALHIRFGWKDGKLVITLPPLEADGAMLSRLDQSR